VVAEGKLTARALLVVLGVTLLGVVFALLLHRGDERAPESTTRRRQRRAEDRPANAERPAGPGVIHPSTTEHAEAAVEEPRGPNSPVGPRFVTMLRDRTAARARLPMSDAESQANELVPFVSGWLEGALSNHPEDARSLGDAIAERLCSTEQPLLDTERLLLVNALTDGRIPNAATTRGVSCVLDRQYDGAPVEDVATWAALDAWSARDRPHLGAVEALRGAAADPRTLSRIDGSRDRERSEDPASGL
jgi:hypothetical protein